MDAWQQAGLALVLLSAAAGCLCAYAVYWIGRCVADVVCLLADAVRLMCGDHARRD